MFTQQIFTEYLQGARSVGHPPHKKLADQWEDKQGQSRVQWGPVLQETCLTHRTEKHPHPSPPTQLMKEMALF